MGDAQAGALMPRAPPVAPEHGVSESDRGGGGDGVACGGHSGTARPTDFDNTLASQLVTHVKHLLLVLLGAYASFVAHGLGSFFMGVIAFGVVPLIGVLFLFRGPAPPWAGIGVLLGALGFWILILSGG